MTPSTRPRPYEPIPPAGRWFLLVAGLGLTVWLWLALLRRGSLGNVQLAGPAFLVLGLGELLVPGQTPKTMRGLAWKDTPRSLAVTCVLAVVAMVAHFAAAVQLGYR